MFNLFKKNKNARPAFSRLQEYINRDKYFYRVAQWRWLDSTRIAITDPAQPRIITLDPWPQQVFIAAEGKMTIRGYVDYMADKYNGEIPEHLDTTIINQIDSLMKEGIIKLSDIAVEVPDDILRTQK